MSESNINFAMPDEVVMSKIFMIRNIKVMIDRDLAELYGVETKRLKEAVRRNIGRFPEDFMFEMTKDEFQNWRTQFASSNSEKMGLRYTSFCFTEQGVSMLSSVLNSERAIQVNIQIIRIFTKMRALLATQKEILHKLEQLEHNDLAHNEKIMLIFDYIRQLEKSKKQLDEQKNRQRLGYRTSNG